MAGFEQKAEELQRAPPKPAPKRTAKPPPAFLKKEPGMRTSLGIKLCILSSNLISKILKLM